MAKCCHWRRARGGWSARSSPANTSSGPPSRPVLEQQDLFPLLRQVLVRSTRDNNRQRLRVPRGHGWPSSSDWQRQGFSAVEFDDTSIVITANPVELAWLHQGADLLNDAFLEIPSRVDLSVPTDPFLVVALGFDSYHAEGQREAVRALFQMPIGETLIANLPTGSGKSLLAQAPVLVEGMEGSLTVVVVPTVALALDQARRMVKLVRRRFPNWKDAPLAYFGGDRPETRREIQNAVREGRQGIVFTSPESVMGSLRQPLHVAATSGFLRYLVVDEAHLVCAWGDAFRPAFQMLPAIRRSLLASARGRLFKTVLASATLTSETIETLQLLFGPIWNTQTVSAVHLRGEPRYWSYKALSLDEQAERVVEAVAKAPRPYILYVTERAKAIQYFDRLKTEGYLRIRLFHGGTDSSERERVLRDWAGNKVDGVVATSAFGLGVDKADVRTVIHATLPESLDRYYQEVGRGGRDGRASASLIVFTDDDVMTARGISEPTMIRNETGFERWRRLFYSSVSDSSDSTRLIVDLDTLPSHLTFRSDANRSLEFANSYANGARGYDRT